MIEDGSTGVLVEPADDSALAHAIVSLLRAPERRNDMGQRGRQRMLESFSESACGDAYLETFEAAAAAAQMPR